MTEVVRYVEIGLGFFREIGKLHRRIVAVSRVIVFSESIDR